MPKRIQSSTGEGTEKQVSRRAFLRHMAGAVGAAAALPLLNACGQPAAAPPAATSGATAPASGATAPAAGASGTGVALTYMNHSRGQAAALEALTATYAQMTGVTVTVDTPGPADFLAKLQSSSQSGNMPDLYSAVGANDMAPYYKAGWAMNLAPEMEQGWSESFTPAVLQLTTFGQDNTLGVPPGIYGAYWEVATYGLLANPAHFEQAGLDLATPPATTAELIEQFKAMKAAGIAPFLVAASLVPQLIPTYASNWLTDAEIEATFAGQTPWKADAWRNAFQLLVDLRDGELIANNTLPGGSSDNPDVEQAFFNVQEVATIFDGSFGVGVARSTAPDFTTFTSFPVPKAADGTMEPRAWGIVGRGAAINPKGTNPAEALKFIKWLTEPAQGQVFMEMVPLIPANPAALDPQKLSPQVAGFAELVDKIIVVPTPLKKEVNEVMVKGAQSLVLNEKTIDQLLDELDAAQRSG